MKRRSVLVTGVIWLAVACGVLVASAGTAAGAMSSAADGAASEAPAAAGIWGNAQLVPCLAALNTGGDAWVISVSCPAAGECAASGRYATPAFGGAFVASEKNGV